MAMLIIVFLFYIGVKVEQVARDAKRAAMSEVDREMDDLNPNGISV